MSRYFTCTTKSNSTGALSGSSAAPMAVRVCVPAWDQATGTYVLARLAPAQEVAAGPHGVPEPTAWQAVNPQTVDLVVVPGMAFDAHGGRLGYGKGYYDRILATCRAACCKIGVGHAWQVVAGDLPLTGHDVRMDLIVTDGGVIDCHAGQPIEP